VGRRKWLINHVPDGPRDRGLHRTRAIAAVVAALAVLSVAAAGCGDGGSEGTTAENTTTSAGETTTSPQTTTTGSSTTSTESTTGQVERAHTTIQQAINAVLVSGDPAKACGTNYVTEHFLEEAYGGKQGCAQAQTPAAAADFLGSYKFEAGRDSATATVRPSGGLYDGEKITVSLVNEDGNWQVDELKSNAPVGP
jgi:hypothetical protein